MNNLIEYEPLDNYINTEHFENGRSLFLVDYHGFLNIMNKSSLDYLLKNGKEKPYEAEDNFYFAIKKSALNFVRKNGWTPSDYLQKMQNDDNMFIERNDFIIKMTKEELLKDNKNFVIVEKKYNDWGEIWKTHEGEYCLEPIRLDWINANISNKTYYLDELVEHLAQQKGVGFVTHSDRWAKERPKLIFAPLKGDEAGIGTIIVDIEHNLEEGDVYPADETETANIYYFPDHDNKELIKELVDLSNDSSLLDKKNQIYNVKIHVLQNILEAKNFLKVPKNIAVNKRKFRNY